MEFEGLRIRYKINSETDRNEPRRYEEHDATILYKLQELSIMPIQGLEQFLVKRDDETSLVINIRMIIKIYQ